MAKILRSRDLYVFPLPGKKPVADLKTAEPLMPLRVVERKNKLKPRPVAVKMPRLLERLEWL